jgi:hypothetical protein
VVEKAPLDFSKPVEYKIIPADTIANSTSQPQNIYLLTLESAIRIDLRYAQNLVIFEKKYD